MFMLKIGAFVCIIAGVVLAALAFLLPESRLWLVLGSISLFAAAAIDLWFYRTFTPVLNTLPRPPGVEDEDVGTLRGSMRVGAATRQEGIERLESGTAILKEMNRTSHLRTTGRKAKAEVLAVRDTGALVNFDPALEFDLRITTEEGDLYHVAGSRQVVSKLVYPKIQIGNNYNAFIDQEDPQQVFISF